MEKIMTTVTRVMKSLWAGVKGWWCNMVARSKERRAQRRHKYLVEESRRRLQVRMWDGEIYFCVDDVPLLHESDMDYCLADYVELARETWVSYHEGGRENDER